MPILAPQSLFRHQDGQTMTEYAVVLGTIALTCVAVIGLLSDAILGRFGSVVTTITDMLP
jgi:Flp pilus assembly pilin Flp